MLSFSVEVRGLGRVSDDISLSSGDMIFKRDTICVSNLALQGKCRGDSIKLFLSARQFLYLQVLKNYPYSF